MAAFASPSIAPSFGASCPAGETEDAFTDVCTPDLVPNSPEIAQSPGGLPSVDGIPCTGANSGQCIGLSEDAPVRAAVIVGRVQSDHHGVHQLAECDDTLR